LRERFHKKPPTAEIHGCRTWDEFCTKVLKRTRGAVNYLLSGGNPASKRNPQGTGTGQQNDGGNLLYREREAIVRNRTVDCLREQVKPSKIWAPNAKRIQEGQYIYFEEKSMRDHARTNAAHLARHSDCFIMVEPDGVISGETKEKGDVVGFETWNFEFFGDHIRLRKLYPSRGGSIKLPISRKHIENIRKKLNRPSPVELRAAQHEAGHALLCYALRLCPVQLIDLRFRVLPRGNLHALVERRVPVSLKFLRGVTSLQFTDKYFSNNIQILAYACQGLGGIAGCQGNESGADDDLAKFNKLVALIPELACAPEEGLDQSVSRLRTELRILADKIIADPIVALRHKELAEKLFEKECLDQTAIENIIVPATLPDYSGMIEEIGKRFNIPSELGTAER
jgi:hypothetical protein